MNWNELLRLPATLLAILAGIVLLVALAQLLAARQHVRDRRHLAASGHTLLMLVLLTLGIFLGGLAVSLQGYRFLSEEAPVVQIDSRILTPQRWALTLTWPDGATREVRLAGDDFQVDAIVLKWKLPAVLAGLPPLYRLDRISGRYDDARQEMASPRTVIDFSQAGQGDLLDLRKQLPDWLPEVDTLFGSGAFLPLVDGGHYSVSLMRTGALVARPDDATQQRIGQPLGG
ncbi:hypothetical protein [Dyella caseinilytica]|uniref:Uncharacterized protein n=1 Tax=Dyella caseinilytica TaxID=1849581 RepID=A0ABX7GTL7_9GAMM|nr:hypothetical protein [Dyella caseinilytica]QRN53736.1 hypothetical protein ISN74_20470 [Dyella caseinilytica]GFZ88796.1 hypothetical protein GCM10011408_04550 [Dyella caseinilytica]